MNDIDRAVDVVRQATAQFTGKLPKTETKLLNEIMMLIKQLVRLWILLVR